MFESFFTEKDLKTFDIKLFAEFQILFYLSNKRLVFGIRQHIRNIAQDEHSFKMTQKLEDP